MQSNPTLGPERKYGNVSCALAAIVATYSEGVMQIICFLKPFLSPSSFRKYTIMVTKFMTDVS